MKQSILFQPSTVVLVVLLLTQSSHGEPNHEAYASAKRSDSIEVACCNLVSNFFKWYQGFIRQKTGHGHVVKLVVQHAGHRSEPVSIYRIDSSGCREYVEKFYKCGFFTEEWKHNATDTLLAFDKVLSEQKISEPGDFEDLEDNATLFDPALSILGADWLGDGESSYTWRVQNFKNRGEKEFSVDLVCQLKYPVPPVKSDDFRWTLRIVIDEGVLKINQIPRPIRESVEK